MSSVSQPKGRIYKSRKTRPCDACRRRKVTCDMPTGPPCKRCVHMDKSCTFEEPPSQRKRRFIPAFDEDYDVNTSINTLLQDAGTQNLHIHPSHPMSASQQTFDEERLYNHYSPETLQRQYMEEIPSFSAHNNNRISPFDPSQRGSPSGQTMTPERAYTIPNQQAQVHQKSLEFVPDAFTFYIGPTGVSDIHLLNSQQYDKENVSRLKVKGLKYRLMDPGPDQSDSPTIFGITDRSLLDKAEPKVDYQTTESAWSELWQILQPQGAWHLIGLYSRFVDPYFPIIARNQIPDSPDTLSNMPLGLLTAMCATALPFVMYNEDLYALLLRPPSSQELYHLAWLGVTSELHAPSLTTLQACLILQQRLPTNLYLSDTAFTWTLMSTAVSIAQTIGLHRDPSAWISVPSWERQLRRLLWWAVWSMEKWVSLARGMPSHLHDDDSDVALVTMDDIDSSTLSVPCENYAHFPHLVTLTCILSDIRSAYYTVKAIKRNSCDLQHSLETARPLRARLKAWRDNLPDALRFRSYRGPQDYGGPEFRQLEHQQDLDGNGSLHLSYIVAHMTLFRALLRPLNKWPIPLIRAPPDQFHAINEGAQAVIRGALLCVKEFVEFMEGLTETQWNAFWHSWSRPNFAIAGSFMVHVLHTITPTEQHAERERAFITSFEYMKFEEEYNDLKTWIRRWRWENRNSANGAAGVKGLTNLGLMRVETLMRKMEPSHFVTDLQTGSSS